MTSTMKMIAFFVAGILAQTFVNGAHSIITPSLNKTTAKSSTTNGTELTSSYLVFSYLDCTFTSISVIVLAVGLFTIYLCDEKHNQNIILGGLTWSQMIGASGAALEALLERSIANESVNPCIAVPAMQSLRSIGSFGVLFCLYILTVDRVVMADCPFLYSSRMTRMKIFVTVMIALIAAVTLGLIKSVSNSPALVKMFSHITIVIGVFYIIVAVGAYYFISTKIRTSRRRFSSAASRVSITPRPILGFQKHFLVPTVIIVAFIAFHCVPYILLIYVYGYWEGDSLRKRSEHIGYAICSLGSAIGFATDVFTYIFFTPRYKRTLTKFCSLCRRSCVRPIVRRNTTMATKRVTPNLKSVDGRIISFVHKDIFKYHQCLRLLFEMHTSGLNMTKKTINMQ